MKSRIQPAPALLLVVLTAVAAACGGGFSPTERPVPLPVRTSLVDFRTGPIQEPSAFDLISVQRVRTDQNPSWDFLFFVTEEGEPQFRPRGEVLGVSRTGGLQRLEAEFDTLTQVPEEGYVQEEPVAVEAEAVYAVVSRPNATTGCRQFGKIRVVELDADAGEVSFDFVVNPNCNKRDVEPAAGTGQGGSG